MFCNNSGSIIDHSLHKKTIVYIYTIWGFAKISIFFLNCFNFTITLAISCSVSCLYAPPRFYIERVGADRLVVGSDYPVGEKDSIAWHRDVGVSGADLI